MDAISLLAEGIATAEGFFLPGSRPARNHNPGDLTVDLTGDGIGFDGPFVVYGSDADGWAALEKQVSMMFDGTSSYYDPSMSILQVAQKWTATIADQMAWAATVARVAGVTIETTLGDIAANPVLATGSIVLAFLCAIFVLRKWL